MSRFLQRAALAVAWLLIVAVISVGAAGLVAAMANQPATPARAELTFDGDTAATAALDKIQGELNDLATDVERLGELGRGALTALVSSDFATLDAAVADGQTLARSIDTRSAQIKEEISLLPGTGANEPLVWSPETSARRDVALTAVTSTGGLEAAWSRLAAGSTVAIRLTTLLTNHDMTAGKASETGFRTLKYADALKILESAQAMLVQAKTLSDTLANTVDVSTLNLWIARNTEYDAALAKLFQVTIAGKGKVTKAMIAAGLAERKARDFLPSNTSGIVIILAEIGRGGLNQAVIGIEETRAKLQAAVDRLSAPGPDAPSPSDNSGAPSPSGDSGAPAGSPAP